MCTVAWEARGDKYREISSVGEMKDLCGSLVISSFYDGIEETELEGNECLCPIDVRKTLEAAGFSVEPDGDMPGDWIFRQARHEQA